MTALFLVTEKVFVIEEDFMTAKDLVTPEKLLKLLAEDLVKMHEDLMKA